MGYKVLINSKSYALSLYPSRFRTARAHCTEVYCSYAVRVMSLWMKSEKRTFHTKHAYQILATHDVELHSKQYDLTRPS